LKLFEEDHKQLHHTSKIAPRKFREKWRRPSGLNCLAR
jgi:hypothetical protein